MVDLIIVLTYFTLILVIALSGKRDKTESSEDYFLSSRELPWYSVAISTIATNVQGYQFLGMMGSAYLFGLAQANLEINAVQGILMAAFIFVPLYLKDRVITISQFIKKRLGEKVSLLYSVANISLFSTIGLGAALFWGAYAAEMVFSEYLTILGSDPVTRIGVLIVGLGVFSATYTYTGGLRAVVRTDLIQFAILILGGTFLLYISLRELGGWGALYEKTPELMHLHLPADHDTLPWIGIFGMFLLNINYWCANQVVIQRSLAAKSLAHAQAGLLVGGIMKYFMAILIIIPGIALAGLLQDNPLQDPDQTFPYLVNTFLQPGFKGIILCALFASLMSTVDSLFNSLSTLWSIDIYKNYIHKNATDREMITAGKRTILVTLCTGISMGWLLLYIKFNNPESAFTHTLNELRYYINCGIVVIICIAVFLRLPKYHVALLAFIGTVPLQLFLKFAFPDMNYFVRAMSVILIAFEVVYLYARIKGYVRNLDEFFKSSSKQMSYFGIGLLLSLGVLHFVFS